MHEGKRLLINTFGAFTAAGLTLVAVSGCGIEPQPAAQTGLSSPEPERTPTPLKPVEVTTTAILVPTLDRTLTAIKDKQPTKTIADSKNAAATARALTATVAPTPDRSATAAALAQARTTPTVRSLSTVTGSTPRPAE